MAKDQNPVKDISLENILLSFFGLGFSKYAPGTVGSAAGLFIVIVLSHFNVHPFFLWPLFILLTVGSCFMAERAQQKYKLKDPSWIVIDEVLGMILTWMLFPGETALHFITLFLSFRFFDIIKVWPASFFDKKVQHGSAIIIDDLISSIYSAIICFALFKIF